MRRSGEHALSPPSQRVLLVEDNLGDAELVLARIEDGPTPAALRATVVTNLSDALRHLRSFPPDAVVLDLNLPDSRGINTLIRVLEAAGGAPVIVTSGVADEQLRREARLAGAADMFSKDEVNSPLFSRSILYFIEQARVRTQHAQVARLLDATPDAILVVAATGEVRYVNEAALRLFQRDRAELLGERLGFSVLDAEPVEIVIPRREGLRTCEMRVVPFDWQGQSAFLGSIRDLTELKESRRDALEKQRLAEERLSLIRSLLGDIAGLANRLGLAELGQAVSPLLDAPPEQPLAPETVAGVLTPFETAFRGYVQANRELELRNQALAAARAMVEQSNRELEAFSYSIAHDLHAPLHQIAGFSQILLSHDWARLDEPGRMRLGFIRSATQSMVQLVTDLLDLSQVARIELRRSPVDISALARASLAQLEAANPTWDVDVVVADGLSALADAGMVQMVLTSLLGNAQRFTARRSGAKVEVGSALKDGVVAFFVRDNGAGLDPEKAHKLFSAFQPRHERYDLEGTAIDLSIVRRIVERHEGRVWVEGGGGEGATFFFTLDAAERGERGALSPPDRS